MALPEENLTQVDGNSQGFLSSWLPARSGILKKNIQAYTTLATGKTSEVSDEAVEGALFSQLTNMRNVVVKPDKTLPAGINGKYDRNNYSISIRNTLVGSKNDATLEDLTTHERTHSLRPLPQEATIKSFMTDNMVTDPYLDKPSEIYARLMTARKKLGIDPSKIVTSDDLKQWTGVLKDYDLHRYPKDFLLNLFNNVAENSTTKKSLTGLLYT